MWEWSNCSALTVLSEQVIMCEVWFQRDINLNYEWVPEMCVACRFSRCRVWFLSESCESVLVCVPFSCLLSSACKLGFGRVWMLSFVSTWYSFPMQVLVVHTSCEMWDCEMRISACVAQAGDCRDCSLLSRSLIRCTYTMKISLHCICCSCKICSCVCVFVRIHPFWKACVPWVVSPVWVKWSLIPALWNYVSMWVCEYVSSHYVWYCVAPCDVWILVCYKAAASICI